MKNYIYKLFVILFCLPLCGLMCSCSESDDTVEEYPDWQNKNETYFKGLYDEVQAKIKSGDNSWKVIRCWSMPEDNDEFSYTQKAEDCIVVHVEKTGKGTQSPVSTDKVRVHYKGTLLPSTSYPSGMVFDKSYLGEFSTETASPSEFTVKDLVDGFSTALMNMCPGDRWTVYIPYQLGYGKTDKDRIPAYSTLVFDITLSSFYHPGADVPEYK